MDSARKLVKRYYTRYLVSTELYMVEPWERAMIHSLLILMFVMFWYFNKAIILNGVMAARDPNLAENL